METAKKYIYDIHQWNPINTRSFNLLASVKIKPDVKLLDLFKLAPLHNILCRISGTDSEYDDKIIYGKIENSKDDESYYIILDHVWKSYPDSNKQGKIEFMADTVYKTIDYLENPEASPIIDNTKFKNGPILNLLYNSEKEQDTSLAKSDTSLAKSDTSSKFSLSSPVSSTSPSSLPSPFSLSTAPQFCSNPRMKLSDMLIPIGISLILIGLMSYILPKKLFN
jgi:hypothetical protein